MTYQPDPNQPHDTPSDDILEPIDPNQNLALSVPLAGALVGIVLGIIIGLSYAWFVDPVVLRNTSPDELRPQDRQLYIIAIAQEYGKTNDLQQAILKLIEVAPDDDPIQLAAQTTCQLIRGGQVSDFSAIRNLRAIYESQNVRADCDVSVSNTTVPITIVPPTPTLSPTPSITPVPSKTPTQAIAPAPLNTPLQTPTANIASDETFRPAFVETFCDPNNSGIIEVYVRNVNSIGMAGMPIEVRWGSRQSQVFYTGLKPERGDDYADFEMMPDERYRVGILDEGQPTRELESVPCDEQGTLISYRVVLQQTEPDTPPDGN